MKTKANGKDNRVELGDHIVAEPQICHGKPTFKGTRIMVWQLFEHLALGESPEDFPKHFPGRVTLSAVQEALKLGRDRFADPLQRWGTSVRGQNERPPALHFDRRMVFTLAFLTHAEYSTDRWKNEL